MSIIRKLIESLSSLEREHEERREHLRIIAQALGVDGPPTIANILVEIGHLRASQPPRPRH